MERDRKKKKLFCPSPLSLALSLFQQQMNLLMWTPHESFFISLVDTHALSVENNNLIERIDTDRKNP